MIFSIRNKKHEFNMVELAGFVSIVAMFISLLSGVVRMSYYIGYLDIPYNVLRGSGNINVPWEAQVIAVALGVGFISLIILFFRFVLMTSEMHKDY